jgi:hypothetical protein
MENHQDLRTVLSAAAAVWSPATSPEIRRQASEYLEAWVSLPSQEESEPSGEVPGVFWKIAGEWFSEILSWVGSLSAPRREGSSDASGSVTIDPQMLGTALLGLQLMQARIRRVKIASLYEGDGRRSQWSVSIGQPLEKLCIHALSCPQLPPTLRQPFCVMLTAFAVRRRNVGTAGDCEFCGISDLVQIATVNGNFSSSFSWVLAQWRVL